MCTSQRARAACSGPWAVGRGHVRCGAQARAVHLRRCRRLTGRRAGSPWCRRSGRAPTCAPSPTSPLQRHSAPGRARRTWRTHAHMHMHAHTCACAHIHMACTLHMACTWRAHGPSSRWCARFRLRAHPHAFEELRVDAVRSAAARVARGRSDHSSARRGVRGEQVRRRLLRNEAVLLARRLRVTG